MNKPLLSIITVCLNNLNELKRTLSSVVEQSFDDYELIVVDGLSNDGTQEYLADLIKVRKELRYSSEKDRGIYDAMNKGILLAKGEFTIFLNGGDLFFDKFVLYRVFANIEKSKIPDLIYGDTMVEYPNQASYIKKTNPLEEIYKGMPFVHQSVFVKTKWLKSMPFKLTLRIAADYDLVCRCYAQGLIFKKIDLTISRYATGGISDIKRIQTISEYKKIALEHLPDKKRTRRYYFFRANYERLTALIKGMLPKGLSLKLAHLKSSRMNAMRN